MWVGAHSLVAGPRAPGRGGTAVAAGAAGAAAIATGTVPLGAEPADVPVDNGGRMG